MPNVIRECVLHTCYAALKPEFEEHQEILHMQELFIQKFLTRILGYLNSQNNPP